MVVTKLAPQPGKQTLFFQTPADIAIYGGAAGGGKTWALTVEPLRHIHRKGFSGIIFRRTYPQIMSPGGLWDSVSNIYPLFKGKPSDASWYFNQGTYETEINFSHMQYEKDKFNFQGAEIPFIGFDELPHFSIEQFFYMLSRNRSTCGIRPYIRATCNPEPDSWLRQFLDWWINPDTGLAIEERAGKIRYFFRQDGKFTWGSSPQEVLALNPYADIKLLKSVTFIPAKLDDNPILTTKDPSYKANLQSQEQYEQDILLHGNWNAKKRIGNVFPPATYIEWDYTKANKAYVDPAYSGTNNTSLSIGRKENDFYDIIGRTWRKSIDELYEEILLECAMHNVLRLTIESNADKKLSKKDFKEEREKLVKANIDEKLKNVLLAMEIVDKHESENKHVRIIIYVKKKWKQIRFGHNSQPEYMHNFLNYREGEEPDDEADSAAGLIRSIDKGFVFSSTSAR
jgi:hypothetical protein